MTFAKFAGQDGRPIYINPHRVTHVVELNDRLCDVYFGPDNAITIPLTIDLIISDLEKAANRAR